MEQSKKEVIKEAQIPRPALMELLDRLMEKRIIYIHTPAGFGKTVSSALWLEYRKKLLNTKSAWISLDVFYNKTSSFCERFVSALAGLQPRNTALRKLSEHQAFNTAPVEFTLRVLNAYKTGKAESILVFDDLHNINNYEILNLLPGLLKRLPENCTVLLLSREVPPDSFSEMVAKEELAVVDARYLQFTEKEIKLLFENSGQSISAKRADDILTLTGGWAIGVRAILLSKEPSYGINLAGNYFENFLKLHVWERWDNRIKRFMTLISVAEELTPEYSEWLIADDKTLKKASGAELLTGLARENAFLRESGENKFRFHDLFRDFLLKMLAHRGTQVIHKQWNRAGDWFYNKADYFRSIEYYLKGKNDDGIAKSLHHMYDTHKSPSASIEETLKTIRMSVNDMIVKKHPFLLEVQAWSAYVEGQIDEYEMYLDRYYKQFPIIVLQNPRSAIIMVQFRCIDHRISLIKTMKKLIRMPLKGSISASTPSITQNMPVFHRSCRDFSELSIDMDKNITLFGKSIGVVVGEEYNVVRECLYAGFHYERGNLDQAGEHAMAACANISDDCSAEIIFCAMMILEAVFFAGNNKAESDMMVESIREMIETEKAFYLNANFLACLVRNKLSDGDIGTAKIWLKEHDSKLLQIPMFYKLYQYFTTARAHIVLGNYTDAILLLKKLLTLCRRYRRTIDIIEANILLAIVYWKRGRSGHGQTAALEYLEQAVSVAFEYGFTQAFANEGADIVSMLHRMLKRVVQKGYTGEVPAGFIKTLYFAAVERSKHLKGLTGGRVSENISFTEKQMMVMRLMCDGCSRNEIAEKMGLNQNGVKSHITLIYKKLDVSGNLEAVMKIRELGILNT